MNTTIGELQVLTMT